MYVVRFVRKDEKPDETYYYSSLNDAKYHYSLFTSDDSGLYVKICIEVHHLDRFVCIDQIIF